MEQNRNLALQVWVLSHLDITQGELTMEQARRWQQLRMRNFESFCALGIFGFVQRRRRNGPPDLWPETEFADFIGEFCFKLDLVLQRRATNGTWNLFDIVGKHALLSAVPKAADAIKTPNRLGFIGRFGAFLWK